MTGSCSSAWNTPLALVRLANFHCPCILIANASYLVHLSESSRPTQAFPPPFLKSLNSSTSTLYVQNRSWTNVYWTNEWRYSYLTPCSPTCCSPCGLFPPFPFAHALLHTQNPTSLIITCLNPAHPLSLIYLDKYDCSPLSPRELPGLFPRGPYLTACVRVDVHVSCPHGSSLLVCLCQLGPS